MARTWDDGIRPIPRNKEAEQVVLGSALLEPQEALPRIAPRLLPEHFYYTAHQEIYRIILHLYDQADAPDVVAVANRLQELGKLDDVGGRSYLSEILSRVTTIAALDHYIDIVEVKAIRRGLIEGGGRISEMGYHEELEHTVALDKAEEIIYKLSKRGAGKDYWGLRDFLHEHLDRMADYSKRPEERAFLTVPTGFTKFDEITSGLHPSNLIVLAGRPSTGKTSLALDIVRHIAIHHNKAVGIFSMEMPKEQILERLLCAEARINLHNLRRGILPTTKWGALTHAASLIDKSTILVDDAPGAPVLSIRSKARRMHQEHDIDLLIIDYLQLIEAGVRTDIREQEISYISRSLKGLARELNIPVIACSQLNRAVERRESKRPMLSDLRECVTGETLVLLADGRRLPIRDLEAHKPTVVAVDADGRLCTAQAEAVWKVGQRPVFTVRLASGRVVRATAEHRLYGLGGWREVGQLGPGDRLAIARRHPEPRSPARWDEDHVILLAHLIGDGSYLPGQPLRYTTSSEENSRVVTEAAVRGFGVQVNRHEGRGRWHQLVFSGNGDRWHTKGINRWLRELGIFGQRSKDKRVPEEIFGLANAQVALFLRHLWATDGTISARKPGQRGGHGIHLATASWCLATDVAALLLRLGIVARIKTARGPKGLPWYTVWVSGTAAQLRFLSLVGAFGPRVKPAETLRELLLQMDANPNVDTLPRELFLYVLRSMREQGITHRKMAQLRGTSYGGSAHFKFAPSRRVVRGYAALLEDDELHRLATSDLFWDRVVSVEPDGEAEVFDLTVPGPACWLADSVVSHNSGAIEQDADLVVFISRPDFNEEAAQSSAVSESEIIVAKHRNGPQGQFRLLFHKDYASFSSPAREPAEPPF